MRAERQCSVEGLPEKRLMDDDNKYAIVQVHGEELLFDFENGRYYKKTNK
jgi:hypothetical protein